VRSSFADAFAAISPSRRTHTYRGLTRTTVPAKKSAPFTRSPGAKKSTTAHPPVNVEPYGPRQRPGIRIPARARPVVPDRRAVNIDAAVCRCNATRDPRGTVIIPTP